MKFILQEISSYYKTYSIGLYLFERPISSNLNKNRNSHDCSRTVNSPMSALCRFFILILFVSGCAGAGSGKQVLTDHMISQIQAQPKKDNLQERLLAQVSQATLIGYRDYEVGPEDLLEISFFGLDDLYREVRVNGRGEITMPLVGVVKVSGLSPQQIEVLLVKLYKEGEFINHPQITILVKEYRHQRVMVTGAVAQPGSYEMIGPRTLLEMLGKAGGLKEGPGDVKAGDVVHIIRSQSAADRTKALKDRKSVV